MIEPDDQRLLLAASLGDRNAFERFVEKHEAAVFRLLKTAEVDDADAEDALQEAFVAAWRNAASYRGGVSARGWILTIARNALRRTHRKRVGEPSSFEALDDLGMQAGWGSDDPLEGIVRREVLDRAMQNLGGEEREVLVLRELEGLSGEEVAGMMGLTLAAMKSRLHRARLKFLAALREVADE